MHHLIHSRPILTRFIVLVPCSIGTCERSCAMLIVIATYLPLKTISYKNKLCLITDLCIIAKSVPDFVLLSMTKVFVDSFLDSLY